MEGSQLREQSHHRHLPERSHAHLIECVLDEDEGEVGDAEPGVVDSEGEDHAQGSAEEAEHLSPDQQLAIFDLHQEFLVEDCAYEDHYVGDHLDQRHLELAQTNLSQVEIVPHGSIGWYQSQYQNIAERVV